MPAPPRDSGPRYARVEDILRLAMKMQGTAEGVSLADIMATCGVSRRTAERMRDAVQNLFPQITSSDDDRGERRWRLPATTLGRLADPTADQLAAAHRAAAIARREGDPATAEGLEALVDSVKANLRPEHLRRVEPDLEAQMLAAGVAFRPGPREQIAPKILRTLRDAILSGVMISADHRARGSGRLSRGTRLGPIALLLGDGRQYLLAWSEYQDDLRLFALAGFERISLEPDIYTRPEGFDLQEWLSESFGVWREEPVDVEWRFVPDVAKEAACYQFHPKQKVEWMEDGSLLVRFRAGGRLEMEWYLARWGGTVEVRSNHI